MLEAFFAFCRLAWVILIVNKKNTQNLFVELSSVLAEKGQQLTAAHRKRIAFYTAQSAITNHWFSTLRGYKPTQGEIQNALYLGAFTPIADDLMDSQNITFETLLNQPENRTAESILFHYLYRKLKPLINQRGYFEQYFSKAHLAQNESLKQLSNYVLSNEELEKISYNKGGFYTLLYRMVLQNKPVPGEEDAIYSLGAIMQLLNDLFDIHKDFHNGVQTLVTNNSDIHFIQEKLEKLEKRFAIQYYNLDYKAANIRKSFIAAQAIVTRGHVALDYYSKIQGNKNQIDVAAYERKGLIVDMEKPHNVWKNLQATSLTMRQLNAQSN